VQLDHFKKIKLIYDAFPGRIWCISSATLGIHAWRKHDRLVPAFYGPYAVPMRKGLAKGRLESLKVARKGTEPCHRAPRHPPLRRLGAQAVSKTSLLASFRDFDL